MSSEVDDDFELNYIKIDSKNEIELLETDDYAIEVDRLFSTVMNFENFNISKKINKDVEKYIHDNSDIFKNNVDFAKKYIKIINSDKRKNFNATVKRILSIDFEKEFIFNYTNIFDVCCIVSLLFSDCKKYKISSMDDLKTIIKKINFQKYDFYRLYLDYGKNKIKRSSVSLTNDTLFCSKLINFEENQKIYNEDILEKNIKYNNTLNSASNFSNKNDKIKILSKKTFIYPEYNKIGNRDPMLNETEIPVELIILMSKLQSVQCLTFQIQNTESDYINLATFILSNIDWLFPQEITEIKFDLSNEDIQLKLNKAFAKITKKLYIDNNIPKKQIYYKGFYRARSINCWVPECDIFFEEKKFQRHNYVYKTQMTDDSVDINNSICNIYNAFGNLMDIKYIPQVNFSLNRFIKIQTTQSDNESRTTSICPINLNNTISLDCFNESISIFDLDGQEKYAYPTIDKKIETTNHIRINSDNENIPLPLSNIIENNIVFYKMILIYSYYINKYINNIKKLSLYFQNSFTDEISIIYQTEVNNEYTNFLVLLNKIETLNEITFSFNSLDDKSFEYFLGIIYRNTNLTSLKISFFTPDINYYDNSLFSLISSKIKLAQLFSEFKNYRIKKGKAKEKNINEYILDKKLLNPFIINLTNLSSLLKLQLLKNLNELIFRFDIPLALLNNQKYILVIIKFIINIFIMITFQQNKTRTFKIISPYLEFNGNKMTFLRNFFNEISLNSENDEKVNIKLEEKKTETENDPEIFSQIYEEKNKEYGNDSKNNIENLINKPTNSETAAIRKDSIENNNINTNISSRKLNSNDKLENLVLQMNIRCIPEIFNFCKINNLSGLKYINLGNFDEITFKGFVNDYKSNRNKLMNLISLKINLGFSILSYDDLEKYIFDFININSPKLTEKILLTNLKINSPEKMKELIELVYLKANIEKIVIKINNDNIDLLSKLLSKFIIEYKNKYTNYINSLILLLNHPNLQKINNNDIKKSLCDYLIFSKTRAILCNEIS